jgi:hypothetical protein
MTRKNSLLIGALEAAKKSLEALQLQAAEPAEGCVCEAFPNAADRPAPCAYHATTWNYILFAIQNLERAIAHLQAGQY